MEKYAFDECRKCMEQFFTDNPYGVFPYWRCKRCPIGEEVQKKEKGWHYDCLKHDY